MSLLDTLRKNLTPELFTQVTDMLGDDFDYDLVPRTRLNKVISQRNELRDQLAGKTQPSSTSKKAHEDDDDDEGASKVSTGSGVDVEELKRQYQQQTDDAIQAVKIQYAALEELRSANALDPELLWSSNLIDKSKLSIGEDGKLVGMSDIIADLQKTKAHQFKKETDGVPSGTGKQGGEGFKNVSNIDDFLKLPIDQQIAFKKAHPETFKSFMQ